MLGCGRPRCPRPSPDTGVWVRAAWREGVKPAATTSRNGSARGPARWPSREPAQNFTCSLCFLPLLETGRRSQVHRERFFISSPNCLESCPSLEPPRSARCPPLRGTVLAPGTFWAVEPQGRAGGRAGGRQRQRFWPKAGPSMVQTSLRLILTLTFSPMGRLRHRAVQKLSQVARPGWGGESRGHLCPQRQRCWSVTPGGRSHPRSCPGGSGSPLSYKPLGLAGRTRGRHAHRPSPLGPRVCKASPRDLEFIGQLPASNG